MSLPHTACADKVRQPFLDFLYPFSADLGATFRFHDPISLAPLGPADEFQTAAFPCPEAVVVQSFFLFSRRCLSPWGSVLVLAVSAVICPPFLVQPFPGPVPHGNV